MCSDHELHPSFAPMNDPVVLVLVAILPSVVVFLTAFYILKQFFNGRAAERAAERMADLRKDDHKHTLPLRLQAYERLALFAERIAPGALVLRVHKGNMTFVDNEIDPNSDSIRGHATFPNPDHVLLPGMFVRVRIPLGAAKPTVLVSERAIGTDQSQKFVLIVGNDNKIASPGKRYAEQDKRSPGS